MLEMQAKHEVALAKHDEAVRRFDEDIDILRQQIGDTSLTAQSMLQVVSLHNDRIRLHRERPDEHDRRFDQFIQRFDSLLDYLRGEPGNGRGPA